tara:strand:+ start:18759 stop:20195 length:1437 start_codon:yes stop_codon:yes gene_type:complete
LQTLKKNSVLLFLGLFYVSICCFFIWTDQIYFTLSSFGLIAIYFAIFNTEYTFLGLAFFTPLSINIEEYTNDFGLFIPTEPILFGLLLFLLMQVINKNLLHKYIWRNPIILAVGFYLFWILISSMTSSSPIVSFKFLLAKIWYIIPLLIFGTKVFMNPKNIKRFIWLFVLSICIVIIYTVIIHAQYNFGEKEGHWVMWPFFKDHTIYGATVAFTVPLVFALYFSKKHDLLIKISIISMIIISSIGLYFSYSRAAWLSVILALIILSIIKLKIKLHFLLALSILALTIVFLSWDKINMELERNKYEHTTLEFGEKIKSATNITTDASNLERLNRWNCAIEMFKKRPIFGFGPGTYAFEYAKFQHPNNKTIISTNFGTAGNAHSEYLGPLSETGIVGFLSFLVIVFTIFYKGIKLYYAWPIEDIEMKTIILSMIVSLSTYFIHGILNNYLDTDKASIPIWVFCASFIALEQYNKVKLKET